MATTAQTVKPTGGTWNFKVAPNGDCGIVAEGTGVFIEAFAEIRHAGEGADKEAMANARLIIAAKDLKKAAEAMCAVLSRCGEWDDGCFYYNGKSASELQEPFQLLADAIAKSEGQ